MPHPVHNEYGSTVEGSLKDGLYIKSIPSSYSADQISQYLTRIKYTPKEHAEERFIENGGFDTSLENLERLIRLHHLTFPHENTFFHFTQHQSLDADPQKLYSRFMYEHKGAICTGHNTLFLHVLRGLRYRGYHVAARDNIENVPNPTALSGIGHLVILVQPFPGSNMTYLVDVGFGTVSPIRPMLQKTTSFRVRLRQKDFVYSDALIQDRASVSIHFLYAFHLILSPLSSDLRQVHAHGVHSKWVLEMQTAEPPASSATWLPLYTFSEEETYERDIANASLSARLHPDAAIFLQKVLIEKYILLDEKGNPILNANEAAAKLTCADVLKLDLGKANLRGGKLTVEYGGKSEVIVKVKKERERVALLREVFGIVITDEEINHIKGRPSALSMSVLEAKL